jgi:hypothetical protein
MNNNKPIPIGKKPIPIGKNDIKSNEQCDGKNCSTLIRRAGSKYICSHNNFTVTHPELAKEWDYEKNEYPPSYYTYGSTTKIHWICPINPCGCHKYEVTINIRTSSGTGCKFCNSGSICPHNNLTTTHPDICKEWDYERNEKGPENYAYGVDVKVFWICPINPCGCHNYESRINTRTLKGSGCKFCNLGVACPHNNLTTTHPELAKQWDYGRNEKGPEHYTFGSRANVNWICPINPCGCHNYESQISSRTLQKSGCKFCNSGISCPHNNLTITYPELCKEWDYERNEKGPENYTHGSNVKVHWVCLNNACGCHKYISKIKNRTTLSRGCKYCNSGFVCEHNNLMITHPKLYKEWDFTKNTYLPKDYTYGSGKKFFWLCNNNHSYKVPINYRTNYRGCPLCKTSKFSKISIEWINSISEKENVYIQCATNNGEYKIEGVGKVDGYCLETNTVYEFHGDFWHGNPLLFDPDDINPVSNKKYGELYHKTIERDKSILSKGYNLVTMWENNYRINNKNLFKK